MCRRVHLRFLPCALQQFVDLFVRLRMYILLLFISLSGETLLSSLSVQSLYLIIFAFYIVPDVDNDGKDFFHLFRRRYFCCCRRCGKQFQQVRQLQCSRVED